MLRAFLYKTSSKLKQRKTNFEHKKSFILKIFKSELINNDSKDENNVTEKSEASDDEHLSNFTKLQPYMYKKSQRVRERKLPGKES